MNTGRLVIGKEDMRRIVEALTLAHRTAEENGQAGSSDHLALRSLEDQLGFFAADHQFFEIRPATAETVRKGR